MIYFLDVKDKINEDTEFNLQISERENEIYLENFFENIPEYQRERIEGFNIGKFGSAISIMGPALTFLRAPWWSNIEKNLVVDNISEDIYWDLSIRE